MKKMNQEKSPMKNVKEKFCPIEVFRLAFTVVSALIIIIITITSTPARAQFVCGGSTNGSGALTGGGATAAGSSDNFACGQNANASGNGSNNTATGTSANASGAKREHRDRKASLRQG